MRFRCRPLFTGCSAVAVLRRCPLRVIFRFHRPCDGTPALEFRETSASFPSFCFLHSVAIVLHQPFCTVRFVSMAHRDSSDAACFCHAFLCRVPLARLPCPVGLFRVVLLRTAGARRLVLSVPFRFILGFVLVPGFSCMSALPLRFYAYSLLAQCPAPGFLNHRFCALCPVAVSRAQQLRFDSLVPGSLCLVPRAGVIVPSSLVPAALVPIRLRQRPVQEYVT